MVGTFNLSSYSLNAFLRVQHNTADKTYNVHNRSLKRSHLT